MTSNQKFNLVIAYWLGYLLFMIAYFYLDTIDEYRNSEKATAVVIDQLLGAGRKRYGGQGAYYPQFQFTYKDSIYTSADKLVWIRHKRPGHKLTVIFPKDRPGEAIAYTILSYWVSFTKLAISFMITFFMFAIYFILSQYPGSQSYYRRK